MTVSFVSPIDIAYYSTELYAYWSHYVMLANRPYKKKKERKKEGKKKKERKKKAKKHSHEMDSFCSR